MWTDTSCCFHLLHTSGGADQHARGRCPAPGGGGRRPGAVRPFARVRAIRAGPGDGGRQRHLRRRHHVVRVRVRVHLPLWETSPHAAVAGSRVHITLAGSERRSIGSAPSLANPPVLVRHTRADICAERLFPCPRACVRLEQAVPSHARAASLSWVEARSPYQSCPLERVNSGKRFQF